MPVMKIKSILVTIQGQIRNMCQILVIQDDELLDSDVIEWEELPQNEWYLALWGA